MWGGDGYPQHRTSHTDGMGGQSGGFGGQPGSISDFPDGPTGPPAPGGRVKRSWPTWWIVPYFGAALAVLVVFAGLQLTVLRPAGHASAAGPRVLMPVQVFPDALFKRLTKDIQHHNQKDFLTLVAPSARPAVQTWWSNMEALGFSTGLIMPTNKTDQVNLDSKGDGTTVALAGTHNELDPVHANGQSHTQKYDVPLERYQIGLHFSSPTAIGRITAWKPLGNAPWDQGKLYVTKGENVRVAGPASEKALVNETLPIAQDAAAYDVNLINHVHPNDLRQNGFVVFVSHDPAVRSRWFSTTQQPSGWPTASATSGLTAQLPGPAASHDDKWSLGNLAPDTTGGARVVITPFEDQNGARPADERAQLVTRFALDILSANDQPFDLLGASPPSVPAWAIEGFGVAFEAMYLSNTSATPDEYSFKALNDALKKLPASFKNGDLPTAKQLYNSPDATEQNWLVVAASVYAYIGTHHGIGQLLGSAGLMWTQFADPRGNVLKSSTDTTLTFFGKDTIVSGWKAYLANPTDKAPANGPSGV